VNIIGVVPTATEFPSTRERVRALHRTLAPGALPTMLPNFTDHDDGDVAAAAGNADRIRELRRRYDPAAIFGRS
jgi:hypothetical protein